MRAVVQLSDGDWLRNKDGSVRMQNYAIAFYPNSFEPVITSLYKSWLTKVKWQKWEMCINQTVILYVTLGTAIPLYIKSPFSFSPNPSWYWRTAATLMEDLSARRATRSCPPHWRGLGASETRAHPPSSKWADHRLSHMHHDTRTHAHVRHVGKCGDFFFSVSCRGIFSKRVWSLSGP